jgi:multidrug efflux pump subunit AcrA (membrane-fusion protein)
MIQKIKVNFSISYVLLTGLLLFIIWALIFDIDKSVRSQGVVVATKNNQIIQVADGGILENILVSEGDIVYKNQQIASLENKRIEADYKQIQVENAYLQSLINRIDAQILNKNIVFSKEIKTPASKHKPKKYLIKKSKNHQKPFKYVKIIIYFNYLN